MMNHKNKDKYLVKMVSKSVSTIALIVFVLGCVHATPDYDCFRIASTLHTRVGTTGAVCYHYVGDSVCECAKTSTYADGQAVNTEGWSKVRVNPTNAPYTVNLYSGALMTFPTDKCCPPPTFMDISMSCEDVVSLGSCCTDGSSTFVTGLPSQAQCVHETVGYSAGTPDGSGDVTFDVSASSVEVYASPESAGSCGHHDMYLLTCGSCSRRLRIQ